jgi:REP element-mobilizing transposase RayT
MRRTRTRQQTIDFRTHGGVRAGAGRKPNGNQPGVRHRERGELGGRVPLLVTLKLLRGIGNLRTRGRCKAILGALQKARDRLGTRIVEFSIQHDHIHMIVEARDAGALTRAMQGLSVRLARQLNRVLGRRGAVFADRYHHRTLGKPRQVRNALAYVLATRASTRSPRIARVGSIRSRRRARSTGGRTARPITRARRPGRIHGCCVSVGVAEDSSTQIAHRAPCLDWADIHWRLAAAPLHAVPLPSAARLADSIGGASLSGGSRLDTNVPTLTTRRRRP